MKKLVYLLVAVASLCFTQCTKPTKGFVFTVSPNVFDYTATLKFYNAATPGVAPTGLTLTISGDAAASVYEISGVKTFNVVDGIITMGILPGVNPTSGKPTKFVVTAKAPGYLDAQVPVVITAGQPIKLINVSMINLAAPPSGVNVAQTSTALTGGATSTPVSVATPTANPGDQVVTIDIPAGTSFKDAANNTLSGNTLHSTVVSFGTNSAGSLNAFPGSTVSSNVVDQTGSTVAGMFQTAGFSSITMDVDNAVVKNFSQPITLHMGVNPDQVNPKTGVKFVAGDIFPIWSYQTETMQWKYEKDATIVNNAGSLEAVFTTTHLTYYNMAILNNICTSASIQFATGLANQESFLMDVFTQTDPNIPVVAGYLIQVADNGTVDFSNVPTGNLVVKVYRNTPANSQTNFAVRDGSPVGTYTGTLCGGTSNIALSIPVTQNITFNIQGQ